MWSYDEDWVKSDVGPALHQQYFDAGRIPSEDTDYDVWPSRVMANIYQNNLKQEVALAKVVQELKTELNPFEPPLVGDEHGPLTIQDAMFVDEDGKYYNSLCISSFHLIYLIAEKNYSQFDAVVQQAIDLGFREFRTFASFSGTLGQFIPTKYHNYNEIILEYIGLIEQLKKRSEITVFADAQNWMTSQYGQSIFFGQMVDRIDGHDLISGELANEYPKNGVDPTQFVRPHKSNIWSSGSGLSDQDVFPTVWDYVTYHEGRPYDWPRRNNCRDIRTTYRVPVRSDEPMGAGVTNIPGRRSNVPQDFYEFATNQALNSNGLTFHSESGLYSKLLEGAEIECAQAAVEGFNTVTADWFTGLYTRGGLSDCPLEHDDAKELRTFCRIRANQARCIVIRSDHSERESRDGWEINSMSGPIDEFVELELP